MGQLKKKKKKKKKKIYFNKLHKLKSRIGAETIVIIIYIDVVFETRNSPKIILITPSRRKKNDLTGSLDHWMFSRSDL